MEHTPEQRQRHLKAIEKIENTPRPEKWRLIKNLLLELKPWLVTAEAEHAEACKELRLKSENKYAQSKSGAMRNTMKIFGPVYQAITRLDPEAVVEMSGRNKGLQVKLGKQLYDAFPEYRIARRY